MLKFPELTLIAALISSPALADPLGLGSTATDAEIAAWNIDIRPDGAGLPEGRGDVYTGEELFIDKCAACHGDFGEAVDRWPQLAGGFGTIDGADPVKTVGSYWPYASTIWDYIHRAMPFGEAQSLTDDEVYALTAYVLYLNDVVDDDFELNRDNFTDIKLENEANFYLDDRTEVELPLFTVEPCMENCKPSVEITARAAVVDVTPEETAANEAAAKTPEPVQEVVEFDPDLVAAGKRVFRKCKACHQVGEGAKNRVGPILTDIIGRPAATFNGFDYSKALTEAAANGLIWNADTLAEFLAKPKAMVPKTKMSFAGLRKEDDIKGIIAYLTSLGIE